MWLNKKKEKYCLRRLDRMLADGKVYAAHEYISKLKQKYYVRPDRLRPREALLELEVLAASKPEGAERIPQWWTYAPYPGNVGDSINPWIIHGLTGRVPKWVRPETPGALLAIGSIAHLGGQEAEIWGSGILSRQNRVDELAHYNAVRGPITRRIVLDAGAECPAVYGDPAVFAPSVFAKPRSKADRIGVILHYAHQGEVAHGDALFIDVRCATSEDFSNFVSSLAKCEYVFSSSLHGIILARSYGVSARRLMFPDSPLDGDGSKFSDYFLGIGCGENESSLDARKIKRFDESVLRRFKSGGDPIRYDGRPLLEAFPYRQQLLEYSWRHASDLLA